MDDGLGSIAISAHHDRAAIPDLVATIRSWAQSHGVDVWQQADEPQRPLGDADLVVALGGDGTMLRAVAAIDGAPVPILGVNLGQLGYLTEIDPSELAAALDRVVAAPDEGGWHLDERLMLDAVACRGDTERGRWRALNEAVVEKSESGQTVRLFARIDGEPFTSYAADGLIVATPTGSTAYSLSARGPVVSPRHRALLLTPVSPHMLFDRTLVLDPSEVVEVEVGDRPAALAVDGQVVIGLSAGDVVRCTPSTATARFVRFGPYHFHQILKRKFGLTDR